jgi:pectate lyase
MYRALFVITSFTFLVFSNLSSQTSQIPAFPGAEGGGAFATGGRCGQIVYVTSLEDNKEIKGTLRWAIGQRSPKIIMFKIAGIIDLKSELKISKGDVTIAGQSAPGDGITIKGYPVIIDADNVILRYLRFRMGDENMVQDDALKANGTKNVIIDHCSMSWSTDECASFYDNENFTLQWSIISESLRNSIHKKGSHGFGGIWGGKNATFHHNLLAHHDSRNPRFNGYKRSGLGYRSLLDEDRVDFRNNVIYNWGSNSSYGGESGKYNIVANYFKAGPATKKSVKSRITSIDMDQNPEVSPPGFGKYFITDNYVDGYDEVTKDNWKGVHISEGVNPEICRVSVPFQHGIINTQSAQEAYSNVLKFSGASIVRDAIDKRIVNEVKEGTYTYTGSNGSTNGIIDSQKDVGGWPVYSFKSTEIKPDTDGDGMPDWWENKHKLNKKDASDGNLFTLDKNYTNIEIYLNQICK